MKTTNTQNIKIACIYILFGFGGLWHLLDWFQSWMRILAAPLIIAVSIFLFYEVFKSIHDESRNRFTIWSIIVFSVGLGLEICGVHTRFPFGGYQYGPVLKPKLFEVPIAIGFAWFLITLSSLMIAIKYVKHCIKKHYSIPIIAAILMLIFDFIMEHAAPKLDYWMWFVQQVPLQNYLSWFSLGFLFSSLWFFLKIPANFSNSFGVHVYISQVIYFLLVLL